MDTSEIPVPRSSPMTPQPTAATPTYVVAAVAPDDNDDVMRVAWVRASTMGYRLLVCTVVADASEVSAAYATLSKRAVAQLPADADLQLDVRIGDKVDEILSVASSHETALIVIGRTSEREGVFARIFRPSLPTRLLRGASCPVLITRYSPPTGRILAATDLGDASKPVLAAAAAEVARCGGQITAVHVVAPIPVMPVMDVPETLPVSTEELVTSAQTELRHNTESAGLAETTTVRVEMGSPGERLVEIAIELAADLIIVGTHGRGGAKRVLLGSVAEAVLRDAPCNVLVVRLTAPSPSEENPPAA